MSKNHSTIQIRICFGGLLPGRFTACTDFLSDDNSSNNTLSMSFCPIGFRVRVPLTRLFSLKLDRKSLDKKMYDKKTWT